MCDNHSIDDMLDYVRRSHAISRRKFGALSLGMGLAMSLPRAADAAEVVETDIDIKTPDGVADSYFVHPASGTYPGVLMWTDIMGLRPAFKSMGRRLAESGYAVLVPNPFYRTKKAPIVAEGASFQDEETRKTLMSMMGSLTQQTAFTDAKAFVDWLDAQPSVDKKKKMGTAGYCMGGPLVLRTAAAMPNRIGAGATFHGAALASDKTDSPHLLIPKMKGQFLIAIAASDDEREPKAKDMLKEAFAAAKLPAEIEVYAGTMHGWCPPDSMVYDEAQAEKAWSRLLALYKKALV
jgi:carboxymethylenebutenolidase